MRNDNTIVKYFVKPFQSLSAEKQKQKQKTGGHSKRSYCCAIIRLLASRNSNVVLSEIIIQTVKKNIRIPLKIADDFAELSATGTNRKGRFMI